MSELRKQIEDVIKTNRPKLGKSSLTTYVSTLFNLHKNMKSNNDNLDFFQEDEKILNFLESKNPKTRKTILSALFVLTGNQEYQKVMLQDCKVVNDEYKMQEKTKTQEENWVPVEEIKTLYDKHLDDVKKMFKIPASLNYQKVVDFWLLAFLGAGVSGITPRRSMDYALLKIENYDPSVDNYYKNGKMYFNSYKTAKVYGEQIVDIPKTLLPLVKKWCKINPTNYFLFSSNNKPLSSSQINKMLNKIFNGKKISTDILRHIFVSAKYKNVPALTDMLQTANELGHSLNTSLEYIKK
jgi:integrase